MYAGVLFLHRSGHYLHAHIVIYRAGGDDGVAVGIVGEQVKKFGNERDHLIHIELKIGELVPCRQTEARYISVPAPELGSDKFGVIYKSYLPALYVIHYSTKMYS